MPAGALLAPYAFWANSGTLNEGTSWGLTNGETYEGFYQQECLAVIGSAVSNGKSEWAIIVVDSDPVVVVPSWWSQITVDSGTRRSSHWRHWER